MKNSFVIDENKRCFLNGQELKKVAYKMDKKQTGKVSDALVNFVIKVAEGDTTSETEVAVLPEVAKILLSN